jgi:hypothetical protein
MAENADLKSVENGARAPHREIMSLEENDRISVSVPDADLKPGQPFTQQFNFHGSQIMYVYGYCRAGESLQTLDMRWIQNSSHHSYLEKHDGQSLPVLTEPGDYIFALKLLHSRNFDIPNRTRWEEVVLIWTLSVAQRSDG